MKTSAFRSLFTGALFFAMTPLSQPYRVIEDQLEECADWAERGECHRNPKYMQENCPASCIWQESHDKRMKERIGEHITP